MAKDPRNPKITIEGEDKTGEAFKSAQAKLRNLASSAAVLEGPLGKVAGRINSVGAALGRMNPGVLAGSVGLAGFVALQKQALDVGIEYEKQLFRLEAQTRLTGNASGFTAQQLDEQAKALDANTLAGQKNARDAISVLLTYDKIVGETFTNALKLSQDMSAVWGTDLASNAEKLGRALENPAEGVDLLSRKFPQLNRAMLDNIRLMAETGDIAGAQAKIIDTLTAAIGGSGTAEAKGAAGAVDTLSMNWTNLLQSLSATETYTNFINKLATGIKNLESVIDPSKQQKYNDLIAQRIELERQVAQAEEGIFGISFSGAKALAQEKLDNVNAQIKAMNEYKTAVDKNNAAIDAQSKKKFALAEAEARLKNEEEKRFRSFQAANEQEKAIYDERERTLKSNAAAYEAMWIKAEPPLERLAAQYQRDAEKMVEIITHKNEFIGNSEEELSRELNRLLAKYNREVEKYTQKEIDAWVNKARRIEETLGDEEAAVEAKFERQTRIVAEAMSRIKDNTSAEFTEMLDLMSAIVDDKSNNAFQKMVDDWADAIGSMGDIMGTFGDYYDDLSRRQTSSNNKRFEDQADAVRDSLQRGVIDTGEANRQLAAIEEQRVQQNDDNARKNFETAKKYQRAAAILSTYAAASAALGDVAAFTWQRFAAATAVTLAGLANLHKINTTQYDGGGSITPVTSSYSPPPAASSGPTEQAVTRHIVIVGNDRSTFTMQQIRDLADGLNELSGNFGVQVVNPNSRNARDIVDRSNNSTTTVI